MTDDKKNKNSIEEETNTDVIDLHDQERVPTFDTIDDTSVEEEYEDEDLQNSESTLEIEIEDYDDDSSNGVLSKITNIFKAKESEEESEEEPEAEAEAEAEEATQVKNKFSSLFSKGPKKVDQESLEPKNIDEEKKNGFNTLLNKLKRNQNNSERTKNKPDKGFSDLTPEQIIPFILGKSTRKSIHKFFIVSLVFISFYNIGKFVGLMASKSKKSSKAVHIPLPRTKNTYARDISKIKRNNIFNAKENLEDKIVERKNIKPEESKVKVCKSANKRSSLPLKLLHTIVLQDSVKSVASVTKRGKVHNFREGDKIDGIAEIGSIETFQLIVKNLNSGECEYISTSKGKKKQEKRSYTVLSPKKGKSLLKKNDRISSAGNVFKIKKSLRDDLLSNIGDVLTQARAIQIKNPDGTLSFRMTEIVPGSIYSQLNIQNDDIITGINGKKINNLNDMMGMFGQLKSNDSYDLTIKRDGTIQTLNYNFTD